MSDNNNDEIVGYTIIYWGDSREVAYLSWAEVDSDDTEANAEAHQWERITPAFMRFLAYNQTTEVLEHCPYGARPPFTNEGVHDRIKFWEQQLREQGYDVVA